MLLSCAQRYPDNAVERLKCYDQLTALPTVVPPNVIHDNETEANKSSFALLIPGTERSYLTKAWNLDNQTNFDASQLGRIQPYRQTYLLVKSTNNPNRQPISPTIGNSTLSPADINAWEAKFQLSFKADIGNQRNLDFLGLKTARIWGAYTQQSNWQAFNFRNSSPFRETVYEPELIATFGTGHASGLKLINIGGVHQSNGRSIPESRSWYRIYLLGGWEWDDTTSVLVRSWRRIPENVLTDDNPDIIDYIGSGDVVVRWEPSDKKQAVAMLLRNNLSRSNNRGYMQIDWATSAKFGNAGRWHVQMASGYGENLSDYNHRQNTLGLGVSFREW